MCLVARFAEQKDVEEVVRLLQKVNIRVQGIAEIIDHFVLLEDAHQNIKLTLGIETIENVGILRALVLTKGVRVNDLFISFEKMLRLAKDKQLTALYLATSTDQTQTLLNILGFQKINEGDIPTKVFQSPHFTHLCEQKNVHLMKIVL